MFSLHDIKLAQLHQEKLQAEASNWRKAYPNQTYLPNQARKRKQRRR